MALTEQGECARLLHGVHAGACDLHEAHACHMGTAYCEDIHATWVHAWLRGPSHARAHRVGVVGLALEAALGAVPPAGRQAVDVHQSSSTGLNCGGGLQVAVGRGDLRQAVVHASRCALSKRAARVLQVERRQAGQVSWPVMDTTWAPASISAMRAARPLLPGNSCPLCKPTARTPGSLPSVQRPWPAP